MKLEFKLFFECSCFEVCYCYAYDFVVCYSVCDSVFNFDAVLVFFWLSKTDVEHDLSLFYVLPAHDVAITAIAPSKTVVGKGYSMFINLTVENQGTYTEIFNVTAYANTTIIDTLVNITLTGGNSTIGTFTWNTSGFAKGNYTISAYAWPVEGETDLSLIHISEPTRPY